MRHIVKHVIAGLTCANSTVLLLFSSKVLWAFLDLSLHEGMGLVLVSTLNNNNKRIDTAVR